MRLGAKTAVQAKSVQIIAADTAVAKTVKHGVAVVAETKVARSVRKSVAIAAEANVRVAKSVRGTIHRGSSFKVAPAVEEHQPVGEDTSQAAVEQTPVVVFRILLRPLPPQRMTKACRLRLQRLATVGRRSLMP